MRGNDASQQRKEWGIETSAAGCRMEQITSRGRNKPEWMIVHIVQLAFAELNPLVPLDGSHLLT